MKEKKKRKSKSDCLRPSSLQNEVELIVIRISDHVNLLYHGRAGTKELRQDAPGFGGRQKRLGHE
jgi:hypothetical protein